MTQMRVQITTPYGVTTHDFADDERDVLVTDHGDILVTNDILQTLLNAAERATREEQGDMLIAWDMLDEHDVAIALERIVLGRRTLEVCFISAQDPGMYASPDGVDFSEVDAYELDALPFDVVAEDVTGQLYDEVKAGEA